jgi:hypothetical protein
MILQREVHIPLTLSVMFLSTEGKSDKTFLDSYLRHCEKTCMYKNLSASPVELALLIP